MTLVRTTERQGRSVTGFDSCAFVFIRGCKIKNPPPLLAVGFKNLLIANQNPTAVLPVGSAFNRDSRRFIIFIPCGLLMVAGGWSN